MRRCTRSHGEPRLPDWARGSPGSMPIPLPVAAAVRPGPPVRDRPGGEIAAVGIFAVGVTSCEGWDTLRLDWLRSSKAMTRTAGRRGASAGSVRTHSGLGVPCVLDCTASGRGRPGFRSVEPVSASGIPWQQPDRRFCPDRGRRVAKPRRCSSERSWPVSSPTSPATARRIPPGQVCFPIGIRRANV
jgi:hypothetical protein